MRLLFSILVAAIFITGISSCKKEYLQEPPYKVSGDYFIIGRVGEAIESEKIVRYYLINSRQMRRDDTHLSNKLPQEITDFRFYILMDKD
jgi:hypothetical protein